MWHAWEWRENVQGFGGKARRKETTRKTMRSWKYRISKYHREIDWGCGAVQMPEDRDRWRAVVTTVISLRVLAPRN
jgi:hypothetical protein